MATAVQPERRRTVAGRTPDSRPREEAFLADVATCGADRTLPLAGGLAAFEPVTLEAGQLYILTVNLDLQDRTDLTFGVTAHDPATWSAGLHLHSRAVRLAARLFGSRFWAERRTVAGAEGPMQASFAFRPKTSGPYRVLLMLPRGETGQVRLGAPSLRVRTIATESRRTVPLAAFEPLAAKGEAGLPHWGALRRFLHRRCRASRRFNNLVAAIEMRLGRDEVVSVPQYMALCPTGQCNALCDFCSVTLNRTGIIKRQLPFARLDAMLAPVSGAVQMYGIEGNGEPTLYARFPELLDRLTRDGARAYLITNGSRLPGDAALLLLALDTVSFSLNAASADTHRAVMKLKNFAEVTAAIRTLVRHRTRPAASSPPTPQVFVSFVVTADNVHEVDAFLRFADEDLKVDAVLIRPLSELANDFGTVEDVRGIVPFDSDIADMLDAVRDYRADRTGGAEIRIAPETFRSHRPDPTGGVLVPKGCEGRLLAPRRDRWHALDAGVEAAWNAACLRLRFPDRAGVAFRSDPVPVAPGRNLTLTVKARVEGGPVTLAVAPEGEGASPLGTLTLADTAGATLPFSVAIDTADARAVVLTLSGNGTEASIAIDFGRLRTPAALADGTFRLPEPHRWEACVPGARVDWREDGEVAVASGSGGGPYLLKSYAIPCAPNTGLVLPVAVTVRAGMPTLGVLDQEGRNWLATRPFAATGSAPLVVFTGNNSRIHLVVSADPGAPVDATIRWLPAQPAAGPLALEQGTRSPDRWRWMAAHTAVTAIWNPERLSLSWRGEGSPYLAKSTPTACEPGHPLRAALTIVNRGGRIGVGLLDAGERSWLCTHVVPSGTHDVTLAADAGDNSRVTLVAFAVDGDDVDAEIVPGTTDFGDTSGPGAVRTEPDLAERLAPGMPASLPEDRREPPDEHPGDPTAPSFETIPPPPGAARMLGRWLAGRTHFACQKPWTDLHNFTVDGRMDVCCIATGASQHRYQFGNLQEHNFQEIWNGPAARAFRRSVNGPDPLPPCARCPMLHAYQGLWFDPIYTRQTLAAPLGAIATRLTRSPAPARGIERLIGRILNATAFRGFRHAPRWGDTPESRDETRAPSS